MNRTGIFCIIFSILLGAVALAQAPPPIIRDIVIRGVEHAPAQAQEKLQQAITAQVGQPFNRETAQQDVDRILELGWFFRGDFRTEPMADGVRLIYNVVENPVINAIDFIGNVVLSDEQLMRVVKTTPGEVLNREQAVQDARAIRQAYAAQGYTLTEIVDIVPTTEGHLEFYIFEPKIGEIRIRGNTKTREIVIRRELEIKPGDVYNENQIRQSLRNLDRLSIFQDVTAAPEPGLEPGTLTLVFQVTERRTGQAAFGVGSSNIEGLIGFIDVSDSNLFGSGQSVSARVQVGTDPSYQLSYTNPWIDARRTRMTVNLYDRSILRQAVLGENQTAPYNEDRRGGNITFSRPIRPNTRAAVTFRVDDIGTTQEGSTPVPAGLEGGQVRSISLSSVRDTRDSFLSPSRGTYATAAAEYAGFGGADFTKFTAEGRRYWIVRGAPQTVAVAGKKAPQPWVLASRLMVGAIDGAPPFLDQFLTGGADSLRGFPEDRFPGERMVLMNNELRVPLTEALQVIAFVDAGDAWQGQFAALYGDPSFELHYGYGLGVRVQTPIGPLRLDYGRNDEGGNEFHFGVGQTF